MSEEESRKMPLKSSLTKAIGLEGGDGSVYEKNL